MVGKGLIVSFEGIEKCGKETQSKLLKDYCDTKKIPYTVGREPGGTAYGEAMRKFLQDPRFLTNLTPSYATDKKYSLEEILQPTAELFGYMVARAQLWGQVIKPVYESGGIVILDRSGDSSVAYQGFGLFEGKPEIVDLIRKCNAFAMQGVPIKRTYFMDITISEMYARKDHDEFGTGKDRIEQRSPVYFDKVRQGYLWLCEQELRYKLIDGRQEVEKIHDKIVTDFNTLRMDR